MSRLQRWESRTEAPLSVAALVFLAAYAVPIIWPGVGPGTRTGATLAIALTWVLFGIDYVVRLALAESRREFLRRNVFDLLVLVLPLLRPLRLLRLATLLSVLNRAGSHGLRGRVVAFAVGGTALLILCGALAITDVERGQPDATITDFAQGLWWAVTTMTTVGYGDTYPTTGTGQLVATVLMLGGIALLGVVTATLASWLVERVSAVTEAEQTATRAQVLELSAQVGELQRHLREALPAREPDELASGRPTGDDRAAPPGAPTP